MADTVPAMLEPGEYVLNRNAVKAIGKNKLDKLNYDMAPRDLLSRTDKGDYVIPAGKNIFGQPTEEMGMDELMEMIMPLGGIGKISKTVKQLGKKGIDEFMIKPTRHEGIKKMGELVTTGKGKKEVLENANLEALLMEVKKWARSRGIFEDVIKKQGGGEVPETLLSMFSGGKYKTSQDLPPIKEQVIPALEFMTGAEHVPEGEEASLLNLALAVPFLGKFGKGAKPALSKYYASLFGHGSASKEKTKNYIRKMFKELPSMEYDKASNRIKRSAITKLRDESPSVREMGKALYAEKSGKPWRMKLHEDKDTMEKGVKGFIKEAEDAHKYYYGKQHGGMVHGYQEGGEAGKYEKALQKAEMMGEAGYALPESLSAPAEEMSNMRSPEDLYGTYMRGGPEMAKHRMSGMESRALDSLLLQKMNNMGKSAVPHYQGGGQVSSGNMPAPTQEHVQTTLNSLPRSWPSGQPAEMIPSDVYNDLPTEKNLEVLMPYLESFGRIKTPLHQRNMRTLHRHGLNPDSFTPQMRGLIGRAVIQQLGAEGS